MNGELIPVEVDVACFRLEKKFEDGDGCEGLDVIPVVWAGIKQQRRGI